MFEIQHVNDFYGRYTLDRLRLTQPHIEFEGVFISDREAVIVCRSLDTAKTLDGNDLSAALADVRPAGFPIRLAKAQPPGTRAVPDRSSGEVATLSGDVRTPFDLQRDLELSLPSNFPGFRVEDATWSELSVFVSRPLGDDEAEALVNVVSALGLPNFERIRISVDPAIAGARSGGEAGALPTSRRLGRAFPARIRELIQADEDGWLDARSWLLGDGTGRKPAGVWSHASSKCVIDPTGPLKNLRTYLTIYSTVILVAPTVTQHDETLTQLGVTQDELVSLVGMGRVRILIPGSINSYPLPFVEAVAERAPGNMLFSRRLAIQMLLDIRKRLPWLSPTLPSEQRAALLRAILKAPKSALPGSVQAREALVRSLAYIWSEVPREFHKLGAMAPLKVGVGSILARMLAASNDLDREIEFRTSDPPVSWAASLGANIFAIEDDGYTNTPYLNTLSAVYSGVRGNGVRQGQQNLNLIVDGLLAVDNDTPILDFATSFKNRDIERFRSMIDELMTTQDRADPAAVIEALEAFNGQVKSYERRSLMLRRLNIVGSGTAVASFMLANAPLLAHVWGPLGLALAARHYLMSWREIHPLTEALFNSTDAMVTGTHPSAVYVSRFRGRIEK